VVERARTRTAGDHAAEGEVTMSIVPSSRAAPIIDRAPLPLVEVQGREHVVIHVNRAFCTLLGRPRAELLGRPFCEIVPGASACVPLLDQVYETGQAVTQALVDPAADQTAWLYAMWPALDPEERPERVIIGLTKISNFRENVTAMNEALLIAGLRAQESKENAESLNTHLEAEIAERKRAELELHEAIEQLAATDRHKDEFLAMLAHELRNPLAPIKNAAQILRMADSGDATIIRAQAIIERQADHLAKLVDELLDLSRIQKGKIRLERVHVDLATAVSRAVDSCEAIIKAQRHTITLDLQPGVPLYVDVDATRIDQVLVNLISNAAKYTGAGGAIHIAMTRENEMAVVRIHDTGIGIAPDNLQRVFELFTQVEQSLARSQGGLGLGLKLVKELVELHGGEVEARSEGLGKGSEFIVRLPALTAAEPAVVSEVPAPAVVIGSKRILVVDDIADNRDTMEMLLSSYGHRVELAADGEEAVAKALVGRPDVAFVDIGLPKLSGYEVAREIRRRPGGEHLVLIALSGYGQPEDKRKALESGFDAHLTKPVNSSTFKQILSELEKFNR
jgi:signal transduction histidine kinase/ActR/RegA family two-component response regulator